GATTPAGPEDEALRPARADGDDSADPPIVQRVLEDLRTGALGAEAHTLDKVSEAAGNPSPAMAAMAGQVIGETDEELEAFLVGAGGAAALARSVLDAIRSGIDPAVVGDLRLGMAVVDGDETHRFTIVSEAEAAGAELVEGDAGARLTMTIGGLDLLRLAIGQLEPIEAVMSGRITLTGDLELVAKLAQVFQAAAALAVA